MNKTIFPIIAVIAALGVSGCTTHSNTSTGTRSGTTELIDTYHDWRVQITPDGTYMAATTSKNYSGMTFGMVYDCKDRVHVFYLLSDVPEFFKRGNYHSYRTQVDNDDVMKRSFWAYSDRGAYMRHPIGNFAMNDEVYKGNELRIEMGTDVVLFSLDGYRDGNTRLFDQCLQDSMGISIHHDYETKPKESLH